jgi:beta-phosphoglucomutase family hydrolase
MQRSLGFIFDMDGVLVDSAAAHRRAWQQLGEEVGIAFTPALFQQTFGQRNASIIPTWLGDGAASRVDALGDRKEEIYRDLVRQGEIRVYRRIPELFAQLREHSVRLAIASSGPRANVDLLIDVMGAVALLDAVVAAEDVRQGKPHPEAFLAAAARLGVEPRSCAVIEDSVHGIEAAARAGMLAVAVLTSTERTVLAAAGAQLILNEVGDVDIAALTGRLANRPG